MSGIDSVISSRLGIGQSLYRIPPEPGSPDVFLFGLLPAKGPSGRFRPSRSVAGGAGLTYQEAQMSAIGELVEGYCAASYGEEQIIHGSYAELSRTHSLVAPERFALFSERQYQGAGFPFSPFTTTSSIGWVEGYSVVQRKRVYVPATLVYMPFEKKREETDISPLVSTGLAAGPTFDHALMSGLCECVERDAFTIFWQTQPPPREIVITDDSTPASKVFLQRLKVKGFEYRIYDISTDLAVPAVLVVLVAKTNGKITISIGASSRLDMDQAVLKALVEAVQGVPYVKFLIKADPDWLPKPGYVNIDGFDKSAKLYTVDEGLRPHLLSLARNVKEQVPLSRYPRNVADARTTNQRMVQRLAQHGYEAVVVDLTTCDVERLGTKVVRVLTPELQRLNGNHNWPFLGGRRLYEVPRKLGHVQQDVLERGLNLLPHPFP